MLVTDPGRVMELRSVQFWNALQLISVMPSGIVTEVRPVQFLNAFWSMDVTVP